MIAQRRCFKLKPIFRKISEYFYKAPILVTLMSSIIGSLLFGIILWIISIIKNSSKFYYSDILQVQWLFFPLMLAFVLTVENIILLFIKPKTDEKEKAIKRWESAAIITGGTFSLLGLLLTNIVFSDWNVQLYNHEMHTPIATKSFLTIVVIALVAAIGYIILRFIPLVKLPPLFAVFCISALYLGIAECILWCAQIFDASDPTMLLLCLFPFNCILIAIRTIKNVIHQQTSEKLYTRHKYRHIMILLNNTSNWPWIAFLAAIPLLGIIVCVLLLFGQEPDSFIKAWTQTADWNMSHKVGPQNIFRDEHYLCTVAAGGHRAIVKPIRTGKRHGHRVIVNRQLCIANAFEQLLEERLPNFHRFVRNLYDKIGYPIAKNIQSQYIADTIYFIMKPLEWIFLFFLYLFDTKPENRIAVQYPHSDPLALYCVK